MKKPVESEDDSSDDDDDDSGDDSDGDDSGDDSDSGSDSDDESEAEPPKPVQNGPSKVSRGQRGRGRSGLTKV